MRSLAHELAKRAKRRQTPAIVIFRMILLINVLPDYCFAFTFSINVNNVSYFILLCQDNFFNSPTLPKLPKLPTSPKLPIPPKK